MLGSARFERRKRVARMLKRHGSILKPRGVILPDDSWHYVGEAGKPAFLNSWVAFDTDGVKFLKDSSGVVHIQGRAKNGDLSADILMQLFYTKHIIFQHEVLFRYFFHKVKSLKTTTLKVQIYPC